MAPPPETRWLRAFRMVIALAFNIWMKTMSVAYSRVYKRGTLDLATSIVEKEDPLEIVQALAFWCRSKRREALYVQVSGAVVTALASSALSWVPASSHWSCPAFWYSSVVFAVVAIFVAAQQSLALPDPDSDSWKHKFCPDKNKDLKQDVETIRGFFCSAGGGEKRRVSEFALYAWQIPIMLLSYAVFAFLIGLCAGVISPLARDVRWGSEAKVSVECLSWRNFKADNATDRVGVHDCFFYGAL
ncbi:hypothetical protein PRZ48_002730 [Zasmidium cellare]|uniref:Uncharacterized protein n=1 Tax=Zasmidium cellare TaxID=395010 RepID=A0ABR0EUD9_ZASCE|nr:hypothetical protein PRZ48_002730 [Zasmidium cellare]